jgi:hypothetical protein
MQPAMFTGAKEYHFQLCSYYMQVPALGLGQPSYRSTVSQSFITCTRVLCACRCTSW